MERVMSELAHYFCSKEDYDIHLILYGRKREIFYLLPENILIHKPHFEFKNSVRILSITKTLYFLRKKIKEIHPDTILSFGELWNNFVLLATFGLKYPIYVSDRCQPDKSLGRVHDKLRNLLYPITSGVICQTNTAKNIYQKMFTHHNFIVIGNPIRKIGSGGVNKRENIVLSVGRLIKSKHHDELIRMFAEINPYDWKLIIVGGDALNQKNKEKLEALVRELDMHGRIELTGSILDVEDFYTRSKIFAFTSSSEGFPNVIGEAMSARLPVIAYDCIAGPSELIEHEKTGYLVKLHDTYQFKIYLKKLLFNEDLRDVLGANALEKIQEFNIEHISEQFEKAIFSAYITN
jgi:GalNAc-alpha-(1->4)-GalNAc-alpha-(1->3)-diNAcBac-PP-undecaprenol alpha-1,4-N-acetyl-D-galactosaminyltransferase